MPIAKESKSSLHDFLETAAQALESGEFVRLQLAGYKGTDASLKKIVIRPALIKKKLHLSFTYQHKTRDLTRNFLPEGGIKAAANALQNGFTAATLFTTAFDLAYPAMKKNKPTEAQAPSLDHDRSKKRAVAAGGQAWLHALEITGSDGQVLSKSQDKYRQINQFVSLVAPLFTGQKKLRIADMGSGKGYLTFALYDYLTTNLKIEAQVTGVEVRADLVSLCNDVAFASGYSGLKFVQGQIADFDAKDTDILIALHACDTATDDAIAKGIKAGARAIVVAPCCHKQVRREMEKSKVPTNLDFLTRHGIFLERQAEMITDSLRALYLEACGYHVKVQEFVSDVHTPKNVLLIASRQRMMKQRDIIATEIAGIKAGFGITKHPLDDVL